ncbi:MAG: MFS transporter [Beijerinckiaceae bacterium]|nr:MFS transporter [Beijerinckiaceae bacterium]
MSSAFSSTQYHRLFLANALTIVATGVATVALALLAYELAGDESGAVVGSALSLKMIINIFIPFLAPSISSFFSRRVWLVAMCVIRALCLLVLPWISAVWQIFVLIIVFESAAACFRAAYLAIVADMVTDEAQYAEAAAKARIAYDVEAVFSPLLAALLLGVMNFRGIFIVAVIAFIVSAAINSFISIPRGDNALRGMFARTIYNLRRLLLSPDTRGALILSVASIVINAAVLVNTIVLVRGFFGLDDRAAAFALAAFGAGGVVAAFGLPGRVAAWGVKFIMLGACSAMAAFLFIGIQMETYPMLLALWFGLGVSSTLCHLPIQLLLRRMSENDDRTGLYAAHYAFDYSLLFIAYLLAGWIGAELGLETAFLALGAFAAVTVLLAAFAWSSTTSGRANER